jgi:hypothetical protein
MIFAKAFFTTLGITLGLASGIVTTLAGLLVLGSILSFTQGKK